MESFLFFFIFRKYKTNLCRRGYGSMLDISICVYYHKVDTLIVIVKEYHTHWKLYFWKDFMTIRLSICLFLCFLARDGQVSLNECLPLHQWGLIEMYKIRDKVPTSGDACWPRWSGWGRCWRRRPAVRWSWGWRRWRCAPDAGQYHPLHHEGSHVQPPWVQTISCWPPSASSSKEAPGPAKFPLAPMTAI